MLCSATTAHSWAYLEDIGRGGGRVVVVVGNVTSHLPSAYVAHTYDGGGALDVQWLFWKMTDFENHSVTSLLSPHPCFLKDCDYGVVVVVLLMKIE